LRAEDLTWIAKTLRNLPLIIWTGNSGQVGPVAILEKCTIETDDSWIFFYQGKAWVEQGDERDWLDGNRPIMVSKNDGTTRTCPGSKVREFQELLRKRNRK
jgi:hypothetical protein